jgi:hypothetical protein
VYDHVDQSAAGVAAFLFGFIGIIVLVTLVLLAFVIYLYWRIAEKAGYNGAWSLLTLVPLGHIVLLILFAVSDWPLEAEVRRLRVVLGGRNAATPLPPTPPAPPAPPTPMPPAPPSPQAST